MYLVQSSAEMFCLSDQSRPQVDHCLCQMCEAAIGSVVATRSSSFLVCVHLAEIWKQNRIFTLSGRIQFKWMKVVEKIP